MSPEQGSQSPFTASEKPPQPSFFGPEKTPQLHDLLAMKQTRVAEYQELKDNPGSSLAGYKSQFNDAVESLFTAVMFKIPTVEDINLAEAQAAMDRVKDALVVTTEDPRSVLDQSAEVLGGHTGPLFIEVYNLISEAFVYYELLEDVANNE